MDKKIYVLNIRDIGNPSEHYLRDVGYTTYKKAKNALKEMYKFDNVEQLLHCIKEIIIK